MAGNLKFVTRQTEEVYFSELYKPLYKSYDLFPILKREVLTTTYSFKRSKDLRTRRNCHTNSFHFYILLYYKLCIINLTNLILSCQLLSFTVLFWNSKHQGFCWETKATTQSSKQNRAMWRAADSLYNQPKLLTWRTLILLTFCKTATFSSQPEFRKKNQEFLKKEENTRNCISAYPQTCKDIFLLPLLGWAKTLVLKPYMHVSLIAIHRW